MSETTDVIVVGAGAIGASVAYHLSLAGARVTVLDKEPGPALHQSGRNSGVVHAGYNLKPGTRKAAIILGGAAGAIYGEGESFLEEALY